MKLVLQITFSSKDKLSGMSWGKGKACCCVIFMVEKKNERFWDETQWNL